MTVKLTLLALFMTLFGSATLAEEEVEEASSAAEEAAEEEIVCFDRRRVRGFDALTDRYVFIEESRKHFFLLTMRGVCPGLRDAFGIGIKDTMSRICSNGFGEIIYRDHMRRPATCRIGTIERVENKDEAKALVAEREEYRKHGGKIEEGKDD